MKLSSYLSHSRHGIYYFRWPLSDQKRETIRLSLKTRCPIHAGDLAVHLAPCGRRIRDNKELAHYTRDKVKTIVKAYFQAQLNEYLVWINKRGLTANALADAKHEMLDHDDYLSSGSDTSYYLKVKRFQRKTGVSVKDWAENRFVMRQEMHMGRRDMLRAVLEAAERLNHVSFNIPSTTPVAPSLPASAPIGEAIEGFVTEHSHQWAAKTTKQNQAYLNILLGSGPIN